MALVVADRVQETSTTSGTGTLNLAGAVTGYQTFVSGIGSGNTTYYTIFDSTANVWEVGIGTVTSGTPNTLARTTVLSNSSGTTSPLTLAGNSVYVYCDYPAEKMASRDSLYAPSTFQGSYSAGIVVDYSTGNGRISVGSADGITFYKGGVATTALGGFNSSGAFVVGSSLSAGTSGQVLTSGGSGAAPTWTTGGGSGISKAQAIAYAMTLGF